MPFRRRRPLNRLSRLGDQSTPPRCRYRPRQRPYYHGGLLGVHGRRRRGGAAKSSSGSASATRRPDTGCLLLLPCRTVAQGVRRRCCRRRRRPRTCHNGRGGGRRRRRCPRRTPRPIAAGLAPPDELVWSQAMRRVRRPVPCLQRHPQQFPLLPALPRPLHRRVCVCTPLGLQLQTWRDRGCTPPRA